MRAEDDEMPFRWSLFLPAVGDSPSMRGLKYAVIVMGIILVLGFLVIIARIVYLTSRMDASLPATSAAALALPAGAEVTSMTLDGNRLALHLKGSAAQDRVIAIYDVATGKLVSRLELKQEQAAAPEVGAGASAAPQVGAPQR